MKKAMSIFFMLLFAYTFTSVYFQAGTKEAGAATATTTSQKKKTTGQKKIKQVTGEVTALDPATRTLTVQGIPIQADEKMLYDIKIGDNVMVKYITKGRNVAVIILHQ